MTDHDGRDQATDAIHAGSGQRTPGEPVVAPIAQSATFHWSGPDDGVELRYSRYGNNPNHLQVAAKVAALEGTEAALVLSSGMAAMAMTLLSLVEAGDEIVASRHLYGATVQLLRNEFPRRGIRVSFVDPGDPAAWAASATDRTRVFLTEIPVNPTLRVFDPAPVREAADRFGASLVADLTFASPVNLRGKDHGVDVTVHSATKYLGGHSDLIAGVVAGRRELIDGVKAMMKLYGPAPDPHAVWLLDRGLRTLPVRMVVHNSNAMELARWLTAAPGVRDVLYPGLASHPDHELAARLMSGFGGMVSVVLEGGGEAADRFMKALAIAIPAPSLGGVETLVSQPRHTSHVALTPEQREALGIPDGFVRISVGLEGVGDLIADFARGLEAARSG